LFLLFWLFLFFHSLRPHFLWTSESVQPRSLSKLPLPMAVRDYTEMHGVRLVWNTGGYLHHLDTGLLVSAIIEGFVLVGTVGGVVELLARYAFGDKSAFYRSVIMQQVRSAVLSLFLSRCSSTRAFWMGSVNRGEQRTLIACSYCLSDRDREYSITWL